MNISVFILEERRRDTDGEWSDWEPVHRMCWPAADDGFFRDVLRLGGEGIERRVAEYTRKDPP